MRFTLLKARYLKRQELKRLQEEKKGEPQEDDQATHLTPNKTRKNNT